MGLLCLAWAAIGFPPPPEDANGPPAPTPAEIRVAAERALPLIRKAAKGYIEQRDCFSCHHQAAAVMALAPARRLGWDIDGDEIADQAEFTAASIRSALESYKKGQGEGGGATRAGYALWTLAEAGHPADEATGAVVGFLLGRDRLRGGWKTSSDRPPSEASSFATTFVALKGIKAFATEGQKASVEARIKLARIWLLANTPRDHEDRVFRLWGLAEAEAPAEAIGEAAEAILRAQRPDGGWAQVDGGESDAYATGTALVALQRAGGLAATDRRYRRGLAFLISAQLDDGSWRVQSRSKPFQTYFESGYPHGPDQFISMAAGGWACQALLLACTPVLPEAVEADEPRARAGCPE